MAYRRRQGITRASTFKEDIYHQPPDLDDLKGHSSNGGSFRSSQSFSSHSSLAAQAIRASSNSQVRGFTAYEDATESRGFWGIIAQKAKSILEDEEEEEHRQQQQNVVVSDNNPKIRKSIDKITTSLNQIGDSFEKAFEEGRTIVSSQIRRKGSDLIDSDHNNNHNNNHSNNNQFSGSNSPWQPLTQPNPHESQLKASRDVAMATAAKAKLLLRELKTVKADLAFAKERCSQLEQENKRLRDNRDKAGATNSSNNPADDDLIRLQLETLLAEKARLAHENSIYARENRFLREIVEYHQLTMQDVVYIDEGIEEVAEVNPEITRTLSVASYGASEMMMKPLSSSSTPSSPTSPSRVSVSTTTTTDVYPVLVKQSSVSDFNPVSVESPKPIRPPSLGYVDDGKRPPSSSTQLSV